MSDNADVRIEQQILATIWQEENARVYISKMFPQLFSSKERQDVFKVIKDLYTRGLPFNMDLVIKEYEPKYNLGLEYLSLTDPLLIVNRKGMEWAVAHIKDLYFINLANKISLKIAEAGSNWVNISTDKKVRDMTRMAAILPRVHAAVYRKGESSVDYFKQAVDVINSKDEFIPFSTRKAQDLFGGWTRRDVSSVGGKSGHNKTTFVTFDAKESIKRGLVNKIIYFAIDEPGEKIARRIIASECDISLSEMRQKTIQLEYAEVKSAVEKIFKDKLIIIDDLFDAERIQQAVLDIKPDRFIIDHIQELDYGKEGISDQKVMVASKLFKEAARLTNSNCTIVTQVRDKLIDERFEDKIPRPHDFLYASDLRRKSREQTVVYWEFKDKQDDKKFIPYFDFIVWKSTYSGTGKVGFVVDPDKATFLERVATKESAEKESDKFWRDLDS